MHESIARHPTAAAFQRRIIIGTEFDFELVKLILRNAGLLHLVNDRIKFSESRVTGILGLMQNLGDHLGWPVVAENIVDAALFLCSPMASYITGQVLNVNGGFYLG